MRLCCEFLAGKNKLPRPSPSIPRSPAPSSSRLSFRVHHTSSLLQPPSLFHSFAMPMIGNLHISLRRRYAVPTSPPFRFAPSFRAARPEFLLWYHAQVPLHH